MTSKNVSSEGRVTDVERVGVRRRLCKDCPEAVIHATGSTLWVSCKLQNGTWRDINAECNLPDKERKP